MRKVFGTWNVLPSYMQHCFEWADRNISPVSKVKQKCARKIKCLNSGLGFVGIFCSIEKSWPHALSTCLTRSKPSRDNVFSSKVYQCSQEALTELSAAEALLALRLMQIQDRGVIIESCTAIHLYIWSYFLKGYVQYGHIYVFYQNINVKGPVAAPPAPVVQWLKLLAAVSHVIIMEKLFSMTSHDSAIPFLLGYRNAQVVYFCMCTCLHTCTCACHNVHVEIRQLAGVGFLCLSCGSWGLNSGH